MSFKKVILRGETPKAVLSHCNRRSCERQFAADLGLN